MGLYISAINKTNQDRCKEKFYKKWNLPEDIANKYDDDIETFLEAAKYEDDVDDVTEKWRKEMAEKYHVKKLHERCGMLNGKPNYYDLTEEQHAADMALDDFSAIDEEVDGFQIGYGGFFFIRKLLAPYCNAKYYYAEYYTREDGLFLNGKPNPNSLMFNSPDNWSNGSTINREGMALFRLFMHSDCDGTYSEEDIHAIAKYFWDHKVRSRVAKTCNSPWKPELLKFLDFVQRSSRQSCYWVFI